MYPKYMDGSNRLASRSCGFEGAEKAFISFAIERVRENITRWAHR